MLGKVERKQVKAMWVYGLWIWPFFSSKRKTAMDIMDIIIHHNPSARKATFIQFCSPYRMHHVHVAFTISNIQ